MDAYGKHKTRIEYRGGRLFVEVWYGKQPVGAYQDFPSDPSLAEFVDAAADLYSTVVQYAQYDLESGHYLRSVRN